jgi:hypothetical protein
MDDGTLSLTDHATREDQYAGQVLSTAKLVTTFSAAVAATFVATAMQVGKPSALDCVAALSMLAVLVVTLGIVCVPKATLKQVDLPRNGSEDQTAEGARSHDQFLTNLHKNMCRARWVHRAMAVQVLLSVVCSVVAVCEVLQWLSHHPPN